MAFSWFQVAPLANATEFLEKISVPGENSFEIKNLRVLNENLNFIDSLAGCAEVMVCFEIINNMSADYEAVVDICLLDGNTTISHTYVTTYIKKNSNTEFAKKICISGDNPKIQISVVDTQTNSQQYSTVYTFPNKKIQT